MRFDFMILQKTIADLIVIFLMIPLEVVLKITVQWITGDLACRVMLFIQAFGHYSSYMVLVCLSPDSYMMFVHLLTMTAETTNVPCFSPSPNTSIETRDLISSAKRIADLIVICLTHPPHSFEIVCTMQWFAGEITAEIENLQDVKNIMGREQANSNDQAFRKKDSSLLNT
ncbi:hypothetical protein JTE90_021158 [Oedothorax gibbosus]|uniref:G-protein coupled receptors family 1 profile domain-containing protein n=1 Tax=Oedothorax gibbosus TaxID=931172 RepID=A0AAV6U279_9ARAC|nr:hypothetical protein JTE90_021158 [Oedothorax gibbosus]